MHQGIDFVTVATADLDAARAFYVAGLGWTPLLDVPGEILFFQVGAGITLGLYDAARFAADLDQSGSELSGSGSAGSAAAARPAVSGLTLSRNVADAQEVRAVTAAAERVGATVLTPPRPAAFGGFHAHFADPNGLVWEIAYNPGWAVEPDGTVRLDAPAE
jgi:catechol 2,3-dioxygenase-like lactoylglutathione lyase family enzyme